MLTELKLKWFRSGADGLEVAQTVKKLCRWLRAGADGLEVNSDADGLELVQMV